jgi:hypothetical protein
LSRDEQLAIAPGVFFPVDTRQMEEIDVSVFYDSLDGNWKIGTRSHVADAFVDAVYIWSDSLRAFCSGGDTRGLTLTSGEIDCSRILLFDRIKAGRRMRFMFNGHMTVYYSAYGQ